LRRVVAFAAFFFDACFFLAMEIDS